VVTLEANKRDEFLQKIYFRLGDKTFLAR